MVACAKPTYSLISLLFGSVAKPFENGTVYVLLADGWPGYCVVRSWRKSGASAVIWSPSGCDGTTLTVFSDMPIVKALPGVSVDGNFHVYCVVHCAPSQQRFHVADPVGIAVAVTSLPYGFSTSWDDTRTNVPGFAHDVRADCVVREQAGETVNLIRAEAWISELIKTGMFAAVGLWTTTVVQAPRSIFTPLPAVRQKTLWALRLKICATAFDLLQNLIVSPSAALSVSDYISVFPDAGSVTIETEMTSARLAAAEDARAPTSKRARRSARARREP